MSRGATDAYWREQSLTGVYKHALLKRYLPQFAGKTGSKSTRVVFVDGYAGRGRHEDGTPGSAELMLKYAQGQHRQGIQWECHFCEVNRKSFNALERVVSEYASEVDAKCYHSDVEGVLDSAVDSADGLPIFLFLDPCGVGLPYSRLVAAVNRRSQRLPTEFLLNFSMVAVRRIAGLLKSAENHEKALQRLDHALGGDWWRDEFNSGGLSEEQVVRKYVEHLARDCRMGVYAMPVRKAAHHKPLYYLVFGSRSMHGLFCMSDAAAKASHDWRLAEAAYQETPDGLFSSPPSITQEEIEDASLPRIRANIVRLLEEKGHVSVLNDFHDILGTDLGEVPNKVIRRAIKELHADGLTSTNGVGRIEGLVVRQP